MCPMFCNIYCTSSSDEHSGVFPYVQVWTFLDHAIIFVLSSPDKNRMGHPKEWPLLTIIISIWGNTRYYIVGLSQCIGVLSDGRCNGVQLTVLRSGMRGSERLLSVFQSRNGVFKYTKCPYLSNNLIPRVMPSTIVRRSVAGLLRSATSISTSGKGKKQTDGSSVLSDSGTHVAKDDHSSPTVKYFDYYYDDKSKAWKFMVRMCANLGAPSIFILR